MTKTLDVAEALALLEEVVAGREDHVYINPLGQKAGTRDPETGNMAKCYYRDQYNAPSCIAGQVIYRAFGDEALRQLAEHSSIRAQRIFLAPSYELTPEASRVLARAQEEQDAGHSWGTALEGARETAKQQRVPA